MSTGRRDRPPAEERYRRPASLVVYWREGQLVGRNYFVTQAAPLTETVVTLLESMTDWTSARDLAARFPALGRRADVARVLAWLARRGVVERESKPFPRLPDGWHSWHPYAALFHFGTKNGRFPRNPLTRYDELVAKARIDPPPHPTKQSAQSGLSLPASRRLGSLDAALSSRRTWRRFGSRPLDLRDLATLLQKTYGVQAAGRTPGQGPIVVKTSPSGGARHPIEAYVVALRVRGLPRGRVFHYRAASHELVPLDSRVTRTAAAGFLGNQWYFANAAALVVMAAVFERTMWKYPASHAYRAVLIEAGHLCQTFCLVAASLNLAPFCTIALAESRLERILAIDGITESPIYVAGVGHKPADGWPPGWIAEDLRLKDHGRSQP